MGGTVAWTSVIQVANPHQQGTGIAGIAAGPLGHVAVSTGASSNNMCQATSSVFDAAGKGGGGPSVSQGGGACAATIAPIAFDTQDNLLYGFETQISKNLGPATFGFVGEKVNETVNGNVNGTTVSTSFLGADAAGNLFVEATVTYGVTGPSVDFGLGPVTGTVLLHYDPTGALVSDSLPLGPFAVGALGDLFYGANVTGPTDQGCGTVGTAGVTSLVLTERDATGTCIWSKALPASTWAAVDPSQNVLLATTFSGTIDFGGGPLTSVGTRDLAIAKLDPSGHLLWSKSFGASGASVGGMSALAATQSGGLALAAGLSGTVDFGCGAITGAPTLIASFDATGAVIYSRLVTLPSGAWGPVADGLGGISYAVQLAYDCACTTWLDCGDPSTPYVCFNGTCQGCIPGLFGGNIQVTHFAP